MNEIIVNEKLLGGYVTKNTYTKTDHFCPKCGQATVWADDSADFYVGVDYLCIACKCKFNMPFLGDQDRVQLCVTEIIRAKLHQ